MVADRRLSRRWMAAATVALAVASLGAGTFSLALFTDAEASQGQFGSGSIVLDATKIAALSLTSLNLLPGDSTTDDVVIENDGSGQLRYAVTAVSTDDSSPNGGPLFDVLTLTVRTVDASTPGTPCNDFDGVLLFDEALGPATSIFGTPAPGGGAGERTLGSGAGETLCFRVALPFATGNGYQNARATTTFTFDAEQTANNP